MKRIGFLYDKIHEFDNIELADKKARKNKRHRNDIIKHDEYLSLDNFALSLDLKYLEYKTSKYTTFKIYEPKERIIFRLPYYPDRIAHHAIMNILEPIWNKIFIKSTYSAIKGRGIHNVVKDLKKVLQKYPNDTLYCLKLDIKKFYPSINHDILFSIILKKIKDKKVLSLLNEIILSADGVPIGNYLSLYFATLYLTYFDHWVKEELKCKFYFRYADDIVILGNSKDNLRNIFNLISMYLQEKLKLKIKSNYLIFPVESRGIDFVGYKFYHTHILLRKSIKLHIRKLINLYKKNKIDKLELEKRMSSYFGWMKFCNSKHLLLKIEKDTGLKFSNWDGKKSKISNFYDKLIYIIEVVQYKKYFLVHFLYRGLPYYVNSRNKLLYNLLSSQQLPKTFKINLYERPLKNLD